MKQDDQTYLSIVVPVFNEKENLHDLVLAIRGAMEGYSDDYEILLVDDGSTDGSDAILRSLAQEDCHIRVIRFGINYGQTAALSAGFHEAQGDIIVTMDADLQNDPSDIPLLLEKINEGYDVVSGWRKDRQDKYWSRILPSAAANRMISSITGLKLHDYGCTLKAYRREITTHIELYGEMHRFIPALARWAGGSVCEIPVKHHPRVKGKSKYGISRTSRVLLDLFVVKFLTSYSTQPIQIFGGIGLLCAFLSAFTLAIVILLRITADVDMSGNPLLYASFTGFILSVNLVLMGLIAEMLSRTYHESQQKPIYVIRERIHYPTAESLRRKQDQVSITRT
ncbi:MAG: glycosyltransferase [Acidobacteria bacterium]|nr:MAG: glycosyltransferase [Acidobacteriota bacterium]